jgi:misacylated tRNA(Ala) deacylase
MMAQLHNGPTHILNALVFVHFQGALVTGAQMNEDGSARMAFDLPDADNDRLRAPSRRSTTSSSRISPCATRT